MLQARVEQANLQMQQITHQAEQDNRIFLERSRAEQAARANLDQDRESAARVNLAAPGSHAENAARKAGAG